MKRNTLKTLLSEYNIILILIVILIYGLFFVPYFNTSNNLMKLACDFSMYGIAAIGMSFLLISGEIDLSLGMSVALSTIVSSLIGSKFGGVAGILAAVLVCGLVGLFNGFLVTQLRINSLIATIATMTALSGISYIIGDGKTVPNTSELLRALSSYQVFGIKYLQLPVVLFVLCLIIFALLLHRTRFGNSVLVAGGNAEAGYSSGIKIGKTKLLCFLIGGVCAGITGLLLASYVFAGAVSYGEGLNITLISACVLGGIKFTGGKGSIVRTLLGIIVVRAIINIASLLSFDAWAQNVLTGGLLLVVLIVDRCTRVQKLEDAV